MTELGPSTLMTDPVDGVLIPFVDEYDDRGEASEERAPNVVQPTRDARLMAYADTGCEFFSSCLGCHLRPCAEADDDDDDFGAINLGDSLISDSDFEAEVGEDEGFIGDLPPARLQALKMQWEMRAHEALYDNPKVIRTANDSANLLGLSLRTWYRVRAAGVLPESVMPIGRSAQVLDLEYEKMLERLVAIANGEHQFTTGQVRRCLRPTWRGVRLS